MTNTDTDGVVNLFDGLTLDGWYAVPRTYGTMWPGGPTVSEINPDLPADYAANAGAHPAVWSVVDGAIEGRQDRSRPWRDAGRSGRGRRQWLHACLSLRTRLAGEPPGGLVRPGLDPVGTADTRPASGRHRPGPGRASD
jgi:hypothetical protein